MSIVESKKQESSADKRLALGYGSAWHLLRWLGLHRNEFNKCVLERLGATQIRWMDFPHSTSGAHYKTGAPVLDGEWTRLHFLSDEQSATKQEYNEYWPTSGRQQNWDLVGEATIDAKMELILVEAKAHLGETRSSCGAGDNSKQMIQQAFKQTQRACGCSEDHDWTVGQYQLANRLATLHFLNAHNIPSRLLLVCFLGDYSSSNRNCPHDVRSWSDHMDSEMAALGLTGQSELEQRIHTLYLPVTPSLTNKSLD